MHHSFILPFSLFIKCFSSKSLLLDIPTPSHYHNRPSGQESHLSPQFYTKPPLLYSFAPLQNPTPINTSSSSLFHSSSFSSSLFPAASNREQGEKLLLPPLASIITTTIFINLSPSLCEGRPLLLVWGRVLLRWQDSGPAPSSWFGAELPCVGHIIRSVLGEYFYSSRHELA